MRCHLHHMALRFLWCYSTFGAALASGKPGAGGRFLHHMALRFLWCYSTFGAALASGKPSITSGHRRPKATIVSLASGKPGAGGRFLHHMALRFLWCYSTFGAALASGKPGAGGTLSSPHGASLLVVLQHLRCGACLWQAWDCGGWRLHHTRPWLQRGEKKTGPDGGPASLYPHGRHSLTWR